MRKAFTLIELLIVIVVAAVLAGMMMLSSVEVNATAQVAQVISDLNIMKKAVLMYIADHPDEYIAAPNCVPPTTDCILPYLDKNFAGYRKTVQKADKGNVKEVELYRSETDFMKLRIMIYPASDITADSEPGELSGEHAWFVYYKMPPYMTDNRVFRLKLAEKANLLECWTLQKLSRITTRLTAEDTASAVMRLSYGLCSVCSAVGRGSLSFGRAFLCAGEV